MKGGITIQRKIKPSFVIICSVLIVVVVIAVVLISLAFDNSVYNKSSEATSGYSVVSTVGSIAYTIQTDTSDKSTQIAPHTQEATTNKIQESTQKATKTTSAAKSSNSSENQNSTSSTTVSQANNSAGSTTPPNISTESSNYNVQESNISSSIKSVTNIALNKKALNLTVGESYTLIATISPNNAYDKSVSWTSSNSSVVTVSNGTVKAKSAGTATVTAKSNNGIKASCTVQIKAETTQALQESYSSIYVYPSSQTIKVGETTVITLMGAKGCSWEISNPFVISEVYSDFYEIKVKGLKAGDVNVTAVMTDGTSYKAKITVS